MRKLSFLCVACLLGLICAQNSLYEQQQQLYQESLDDGEADEAVGEVELIADPEKLASVEQTDPSDVADPDTDPGKLARVEQTDPSDIHDDLTSDKPPDPWDPVADNQAVGPMGSKDMMENPTNTLPFPPPVPPAGPEPCFLHLGHKVEWVVKAKGRVQEGMATWTKTGELGAGAEATSKTTLKNGTPVGEYDLKLIPATDDASKPRCFAVAIPKDPKAAPQTTCITYFPHVSKGTSTGCGSATSACLPDCDGVHTTGTRGLYTWKNVD